MAYSLLVVGFHGLFDCSAGPFHGLKEPLISLGIGHNLTIPLDGEPVFKSRTASGPTHAL